MTRWIDRFRRIGATAGAVLLGLSLAFGQVPFDGCHSQHGHQGDHAAHGPAWPADADGVAHHPGPVHGLIPGHCNSVLCGAVLAVLRAASAPPEFDGLAAIAAAHRQSDVRSIILEREPPIPRLSA